MKKIICITLVISNLFWLICCLDSNSLHGLSTLYDIKPTYTPSSTPKQTITPMPTPTITPV